MYTEKDRVTVKCNPIDTVWEIKEYILMCDVIGGVLIDIFNQIIILEMEVSEDLASCNHIFVYVS